MKGLSRKSMLRQLVTRKIRQFRFKGSVLDIGGGQNCRYSELIGKKITMPYESINIDTSKRPTYLMDLNKKGLTLTKKYDTVICIATIEHIYNFDNVFRIMSNCLNKGGNFLITAPFLHRVHPDPKDYSRLTADYYKARLEEAGFKDYRITPLGYGALSSAYSLVEPLFNHGLIRIFGSLLRHCAIIMDCILNRISKKYLTNFSKEHYPLGYCIEGTK